MSIMKEKLDAAIKSAAGSLLVLAAGLVAVAFFVCAGFMAIAQDYGVITACIILGGVFAFIALIAYAALVRMRRLAANRARANAKRLSAQIYTDPAVLATGLELAKKLDHRLISLTALAALAGLLLSRRTKN
ncbi:MAG TPA: hypothetical protein VHN11_11695 [Xanthobacteraceae bacterium]|jgi:type VI protein secretion system component VasK|nr:hypothetical protein [Xanthobacteraceae bacterium]